MREGRVEMSKSELIKYLIANNVSVPVVQIIAGMMAALFLSVCVYIVYRATYSGVMYSKDFNITIVMLALITTFIIMVIGSNLALSLGLVGALSIIRFRTAVKNSRDAAFLFWAIGIGLSCGTGIYSIGLIASAVISAALLVFNKMKAAEEVSWLLVVRGGELDVTALEAVLKEHTKRFHLRMTNQSAGESEATYELLLKGETGAFLRETAQRFPNLQVNLLSYRGELSGE